MDNRSLVGYRGSDFAVEHAKACKEMDDQDKTLIGRLVSIFRPFGLVVLGRSEKGVTLGIPGLRDFMLEFQTVPTRQTVHFTWSEQSQHTINDRLSSIDPNSESMMVQITYPDGSSCGSYAMLAPNDDDTIDRCMLIIQSFCRVPQLNDVLPIQKFLTA